MAKVIYGVNEITNNTLAGKTVAQIKREFKSVLNLPNDVKALVNGVEVQNADNYFLNTTDTLEFVKTAGEKGSA
jgi:hypothetical protein